MSSIINRKQAPAMKALQFDGFPAYVSGKINNHFPYYAIENKNSEVVKLDIVFPIGSWSQQKALQAATAIRMLTEGTSKYTSFEIAETIDFNGAYIDVSATHDQTTLSVYAVKHILVSLMPLIKSILTEPSFPEKEMNTILANNKQDFIVSNRKVMGIARRIYSSMLYGENHPYGRIREESDFDQISADDLRNYYNTFPMSQAKVYLSGNIDSRVMAELEAFLSDSVFSRNPSQPLLNFDIIPSPELEKYIHVPGSVQSAIMMGLQVIGRKDPDFPLLMLTNTILGGYFGSRLMKSIREEKGYTYGISSSIASRPQAAHLIIQTEVKSETTQAAHDEIFHEISRLSTENVTMEELDTARNYLAGSFLRNLDGPFPLMERLQTMHADELDPDVYYKSYWNKLMAATPDDIRLTTAKYINPRKMHVLMVGNK